MGLYRLFLAFMVVISHSWGSFYKLNPGVVAVISFFILSGYVMSMLIEKHYKRRSSITTFYLDRAARLFPQFLFYMLIASACIYFLKIDSPFINKLTVPKLLLNSLILPQGYYPLWADGAQVIPQTWSLGLEMTFYLFIPWILIYCSNKQIYGMAFVSFLVFLTAYTGKINSDIFGYRLLLGTLFMFLVGWSFSKTDRNSRVFIGVVFLLASILLGIAIMNKGLHLPYNIEVLIGLLVGIVAMSYMKYITFSNMDEFFGNLSYGVFLNHFIVIWIMQKFFMVDKFQATTVMMLLLASCLLAFISFYFIERPALKWRHSIRYGAIQNKS